MPDNPVACPDCDLLQHVPLLPPRGKALCCRCGKVLATNKPGANERTLALTISAAIVFVIANAFPLMGISAAGREVDTTIIGGAWAMWHEGNQLTAALVGLCAVVGRGPRGLCAGLHLHPRLRPALAGVAPHQRGRCRHGTSGGHQRRLGTR